MRAEPDIGPPAPAAADAPDGEAASSDDPEAPERRARSRSKEALIKESTTREHLMTHVPKNPYCQICQRAKMYKPPSYKKETSTIEAEVFGDHVTADHLILHRDKQTVIEDSRLALVVKDVATCFMYAYPAALKSEDECLVALQHFASAKDNVETFYSDKSRELEAAAKTLGWRHELSKAYIHQSNAVAERAVRATTEGTRTNLIQAGISHVYWPFALEHACTAYNISNPGGKEFTPWFKRFGVAFPEEPLPFGCRIDVWVGPKAQRKGRDRFEPTSEPAIFMGYKFQPGIKWRKEVFAIHLKQLNKHDFHECLKPVIASQHKLTDGKIVFPMRERYERVQAGLASDATEGPVSQSLTNQDAEAADEQPPAPADREVEPPKKVLDPKTGKEIDLPEGGRYYDSGGTLGRKYGGTRGSKKPESIPSYLWVNMSKKQKEKAIVDEAREQALRDMETPTEGSAGSSSAAAAAPAASKDHWEVRLNECKLIRYHYVPRREMFSPDITDCPIDLSRISKQRSTTIIPVGGVDVIHEDDDWKNVRKRNKKTSFKWIGKTEFILDRIHSPAPDGDGKDAFPAMPTVPHEPEHREKISSNLPVSEDEVRELFALVARPVGRREILEDPKAQAALDVEWNKLMVKKAWDMGSVREWKDVSDEAIEKGKKVHVGKVFEICVEKGSELPKGDPQRKFKGRTVFQGNNVKDENSDQALFSELGSSPATMEAGKALDAYGHAPGNDCQQADGKQAYTQTTLKGKETWVRLPPDRWPSEWKGKYKDPVVRLTLALYGHPDSGGFWELHCEKMLGGVGFQLVFPAAWPSVFFHPQLRLLLAVYVDDFKMAGPKANMQKGWELISSKIDMDSPSPIGRYLGCEHISKSTNLKHSDHPFAHVFDKNVRDPAAKETAAAVVREDYTEFHPEEGVLVRHHVQPRRALYALPASEAKLCAVGEHRLTEVRSIDDDELIEQSWDHPSGRGKRSKLWVGATYLLSDKHDHASALAAVKKIRDKNEAKKEARKKAFFDVNQLSDNKGCMTKGVKEVVYDMSSFLQQAIDKYKKLAGPQFQHLRKVATPFHDDKIARPVGTEAEPRGQLAPIASRILMKLLFAARMARYDLLRAVQGLASRVTKWSVECDKALHRLMCYVASTLEYRMRGFIGDDISACKLWLFADSDHAGEHDSKSTSGGFLALVGPNTYFPLAAFSKKQTSIALSSTEAEVVCANVSLRALGLPSSALWSVLQECGGG